MTPHSRTQHLLHAPGIIRETAAAIQHHVAQFVRQRPTRHELSELLKVFLVGFALLALVFLIQIAITALFLTDRDAVVLHERGGFRRVVAFQQLAVDEFQIVRCNLFLAVVVVWRIKTGGCGRSFVLLVAKEDVAFKDGG